MAKLIFKSISGFFYENAIKKIVIMKPIFLLQVNFIIKNEILYI